MAILRLNLINHNSFHMDSYYQKLEQQWQDNRINTAMEFPQEYLPVLLKQVEDLDWDLQEMSNNWRMAGKDGWVIEPSLEKLKLKEKELSRKIYLCRLKISGKKDKSGISFENLEAAKAVPITSLVKVTRMFGGRSLTLCPFHQDKHPSLTIYPNNSYFCFVCSAGGDVIDFVRRKENLNFKEAINYLLSI